jgi:hypothetical protein
MRLAQQHTRERLSRDVFSRRVRFRDAQGFRYALPSRSDPLYASLLENNEIDEATDSMANEFEPFAGGSQSRRAYMLFVRRPATHIKRPIPEIGSLLRLLDINTKRTYQGRLAKFIVRGKTSGGFVILEDVAESTPMLDPREFAP